MAHYIQFDAPGGGTILVEVEAAEIAAPPGVVKAGLDDVIDNTVAKAKDTFQSALKVVRQNAQGFIAEMRDMDFAPDEVEITFGLKATAEAGNFAIGKINGEANYTITLKWTAKAEVQPQAEAGTRPQEAGSKQ